MARRIVFLDRELIESPGTVWKAVLWVDVPAGRQEWYTKPASWKSACAKATVQELADLRAGVITERVVRISSPTGITFNQAKTEFITDWTQFQNSVNAINIWNRYDTSWDGTTWTDTNNP